MSALDFKNESMLLIFSGMVTTLTVNLTIIDDNVLENDETFMALLALVDDTHVVLQPNTTEISIVLDNDSKHNTKMAFTFYSFLKSIAVVIGFYYENYTVLEGVDAFTDITVGLLNGGLGQEVVVTVSTQAGTATGKFNLRNLHYYSYGYVTY